MSSERESLRDNGLSRLQGESKSLVNVSRRRELCQQARKVVFRDDTEVGRAESETGCRRQSLFIGVQVDTNWVTLGASLIASSWLWVSETKWCLVMSCPREVHWIPHRRAHSSRCTFSFPSTFNWDSHSIFMSDTTPWSFLLRVQNSWLLEAN
jgi:hypothetical protein